MNHRAPSLLALACALALTACAVPQQRFAPLPAGPEVVDVRLDDYRFDYDSDIPSGRVLFRVRNTGSVPHSLYLLPLTEDMPPIDKQLRGSQRRAIIPLATIRPRPPGARTTFAVDLAPGIRHALVCFVDDDQGATHALRGMSSEFRTPAAQ